MDPLSDVLSILKPHIVGAGVLVAVDADRREILGSYRRLGETDKPLNAALTARNELPTYPDTVAKDAEIWRSLIPKEIYAGSVRSDFNRG